MPKYTDDGNMYVVDPNNSDSQVPGPLSDKAFDRANVATRLSMSKTPSGVYINEAPTNPIGFFFGSSASFSEKSTAQHGGVIGNLPLSASSNYENFGLVPVGTKLDIHPTAWSGSADDATSIRFVYKGGLDGSGRP